MTNLNAELQRLSVLKSNTELAGQGYKALGGEFKEQQTKCLDLMEATGCRSWRGEDGTLFTRVEDRVKGQVEDRRLYIRWCLEQDEAVQEFLDSYSEQLDPDAFYDLLIGGLELVAVKEKQDRMNAQARSHIADEAPMPPGLTFRPDPYIQQRRS